MDVSVSSSFSRSPDSLENASEQLYRIREVLGRGQSARVFLALDPHGRKVAVKQLFVQEEEARERGSPRQVLENLSSPETLSPAAITEFSIGQELQHPNIMKIYGLFMRRALDGQLHTCLSTEFIDGKTVRELPPNSISRKLSVKFTLQLIGALQFALSKQFIHGDLHDENIMVSEEGLKLIDLDSFDPISKVDPRRTNRAYLEEILEASSLLLEKGRFTQCELSFIKHRLASLMRRTKDLKSAQQRISLESLKPLESILTHASTALHRMGQISKPSFRDSYPSEYQRYHLYKALFEAKGQEARYHLP